MPIAAEIEDRYPLSPLQQAMLFHDLAAPGSGSYIQHAICDLREPVDMPLLERAWQRVIDRHAILRTAFRLQGLRDPVQEVHRQARVDWMHADLRSLTPQEQELRFDAHLESDRQRDFDPGAHPLMRLAMFRLGEERHRLLWSYHHALLDGRAVRVVLREMFDLYDAFSAGRDLQLPPPDPYRRYVDWLAKQDAIAASEYWRHALAGSFTPTPLIGHRPERGGGSSLDGYASHEIRLARRSRNALRSVARDQGITLNTLVTGAWAQLLGRYSGESAVCFGTTLALRGAGTPAFGDMVGLLINTVPLRVELPPDMPLSEWLHALRSQWLAMRAHVWAPLTRIRQWGGIAPEHALFSSLVVYEHALLDSALAEERSWPSRRFGRRSGAAHPMTVVVFGEPELSLKLVYDRSLFDAGAIVRMLEHLRTALEGALTDVERPLRDQPLLPAAEKRRILVEWNDTARTFPSEACTHRLFEQQVERSPDATAVDAGCSLTYRELNERSNRLAHHLRSSGLAAGSMVGICMDRCAELIVAMLGVMKAGAAYLALDAGNPPQRLERVLEDAGVSTLITMEGSMARFGAFRGRLVVLDRHPDPLTLESTANPEERVSLDDPAYAVYTSGSTGEPKGILITHRALANHTLALVERYGLSPADRRLQFVSIGSDVLIAEVFPVLLAGGAIVIRPDGAMPSIGEFLRFAEDRRITVAGLPSAYWHEWVATMSGEGLPFPSSLRLVVSGMDRVRPDLFALWRQEANQRVRWFNAYGPSETTCTAASYEADLTSREAMSSIPIGRPLPNVRIYILDPLARPVPVGVSGEICIGGRGVARGYLNRPALTAERFVPDPFADHPGARLYKTGDLGRYLPDGNIEFLGRLDDQVKIRGFRVEPGETEVALRHLPEVREACVVVRGEDSDARRLIAYAVPVSGTRPTSAELRAQLRRSLPDYMVPAAIVLVAAIPFTLSGKVDYAALPEPDLRADEAKHPQALPSKPLERALTAIWEDLLQTRVGVRDNFFDLGGDSLRGVQLLDRVLVDFGVAIPVEALFDDAATIATMASRIEAERPRPAPRGVPAISRRSA